MTEVLFIRIRGQVEGPYTRETLRSLAERGHFGRHYEVSVDQQVWMRASSVQDLFPPPRPRTRASTEQPPPGDDENSATATEPKELTPQTAPTTEPDWFYTCDDNEVGPVSLAELQTLVSTGQVTLDDFVWTGGMTEWQTFNNVPALRGHFPARTAAFDPTTPIINTESVVEKATASMAVASFVLGLLGTNIAFLVGSILAIVFGHIALRQISESNGQKTGKTMAIAGLVLGYAVIVTTVLIATILIMIRLTAPDR